MSLAECPNRSTLFDYLVGKLPEDASDSLSSHVESCPECQAELATLSDIEDTLIGQLRGEAAPEVYLDESECGRAIAKAKGVTEEGKGDSPRLPESQTSLPTHLGEYRLIERLGSGGMGAVYKAVHNRLDRVVALKILPRARTDDQRAIVRFEREMKAIGRLDHPHIVRAYDAREIDDRLVLVMEFVEGLDLGKIVRRLGRIDGVGKGDSPHLPERPPGYSAQKVPIPFSDACELARQAALGLQAAHEHGMVHRDVKPSNLMLTPEGQVKLLDLGLARFQGGLSQFSSVGMASVGMAVELPSQSSDDEMTGTGQAMGTADYMAPEQTSDSRTVDIRADIYGLGATLYKLLSGRAPFSGPEYQGTFDKMLAHRQTPPPPIQQFCPSIPDGLAAVLDRMLAKDPAARYQTPSEAAEALAPFCAGCDLPSLLRQAEAPNMSPLPPGEGQGEGRASPGLLPKPRCWRTIVAAVVALLLVGGLGYWLGVTIHIRNQNGEKATLTVPSGSDVAVDNRGEATVTLSGATQVPPPKLFPVRVASRGDAEPTVYAAGTLEPAEIVDVGSALAGQIVSLGRDSAGKPIDYMSPVEPGTLLAQIDPTVYKARVDQEEAGVRRAQAEVALANAKVKGETAEVANASIQAATATLRQCESALALAKRNLAYTTIKSPVKGVIIDRRVNIGQNVVPDNVSSLFLIAKDLKKMQIWAQVNEADVPRIRKGMAASFTVDAFPNETFHGTVSQVRLNAALMKNVVTYTVVVDFYNPDLKVMPYMTANVQFDVEPRRRAVVAPAVTPVTPAADAKAIQGTWEIVSSTFKLIEPLNGGENVTPDQVRQTTKIIVTADSFKVMGEHVVNQDFAYQLKLDATPKMIDLASGGRASLGIFQLTGNELKICASPLGSGGAPLRPSEFWAELGSGKELLVLRRVGDAVVSDDEKAILGTWRVETPLVHALAVPYPDSQLFADQKQEVVISAHTMKFLPSPEIDGSRPGMRGGRSVHGDTEEAYALDPNSRPKIIDLTCYWRMPILATYELQGDHLTVCCEPGSWQRSARPTKLTADEKTHTAVVVLKRVAKPAGQTPASATGTPRAAAPAVNAVAEYRALLGQWKVVRVEKGNDADSDWAKILSYTDSAINPATASRFRFDERELHILSFETAKTWQFGFRFDPFTRIKQLDLTNNAPSAYGTEKWGLRALGIYEIKDGRLKIRLARVMPALNFDQRPPSFAVDPNSGDILFILDRLQPSKDEQGLESSGGRWAVTSLIDDGKPVADGQRSYREWTFADNRFVSLICTNDANGLQNSAFSRMFGLYRLNADNQPKQITLFANVGNGAGNFERKNFQGIYKFEGGRLTIAYREGDKPPEQFEAKPGSPVTLLTLERLAKAAPAGPTPVVKPSVPEVQVCRPVLRDVTDYKDFTGHTEASQTVEVRSRVAGELMKAAFAGGAKVNQGDLLFEIDPRQYQAELDKRMADLSGARTRAQHATAELERAKPLAKSRAISTSDMDRVESEQKEAQAAVLAAEADLKLAKINLDDTKIRAAISGVISRPQLSVGSLVAAGTQTLATIVSSDPLYVVFDVDERSVLDLRRQAAEEKAKTGRELPIEVRCGMANEKDCPRRAAIESKDARMDPATGTARWRATLPNPDGVLMPGMFARVRLLVGSPHKALLIPEQALGSDQGRRFVFVIDKRNTVERRFVETGQLAGE
jgi:RND family efflux transporter MFP subunit